MQNSNSKAGAEAQQSTEADVTTSSSYNAKPNVVRGTVNLVNFLKYNND
jgi:hypothetical protein